LNCTSDILSNAHVRFKNLKSCFLKQFSSPEALHYCWSTNIIYDEHTIFHAEPPIQYTSWYMSTWTLDDIHFVSFVAFHTSSKTPLSYLIIIYYIWL